MRNELKERFDLLRLARDQEGAKRYGPLNPETDPRPFLREAAEQCADLANRLDYYCWHIHFLRGRSKARKRLINRAGHLAQQVGLIGQRLLELDGEAEKSMGEPWEIDWPDVEAGGTE